MSYLGNSPSFGEFKKIDDFSASFNGSTTEFNVNVSGVATSFGTANQLVISLNGVIQDPATYGVGSTSSKILFTTAPAAGTTFWGLILGNTGNVALVADGAISNAKLASNAVTSSKINDNAVTTSKILDANVTTAKITDANVTTAKIADSAITLQKLADGAVTTTKVTDGNITFVKMASGAIATLAEILSGAASKLVSADQVKSLFGTTILRKAALQALPANVYTALTWDTEDVDSEGWHESVTNPTRITANYTGVMNLSGSLSGSVSTNAQLRLAIYKNGTKVAEGSSYIQAAGVISVSVAQAFLCAPGDYFEFFGYVGGASMDTNPVATNVSAKRYR